MGTESVSGWVGICGRQVGCEGGRGKFREGYRIVVIDTFYTQLAQRYTVKHWALRAAKGMAGAGTGVAEAGTDVVIHEVVPLRRRVLSSGRGKLYGCGELKAAVGTGNAVDEEGCQILDRNAGCMPGRGAGLLANAESSSAISWCRCLGHPSVGRRLVDCCCLWLPMKSLGDRCPRTSGRC